MREGCCPNWRQVFKEREALIDHQHELRQLKEDAEAERHSLGEASSQLVNARDAVTAMAEAAEEQRLHVAELVKATVAEAEVSNGGGRSQCVCVCLTSIRYVLKLTSVRCVF